MFKVKLLGLALALLSVGTAGAADAKPANLPDARELKPVDLTNPTVPKWALTPSRLVDVSGYKLNLHCVGNGSPTILMFSGGGWGLLAFANILPFLSKHSRVCAFDRANSGFSDIGPVAPAVEQGVREARDLMHSAGEKGPFLLVGWSLGGMEARQFAYDYPELAAGIVTIDGSTFDETPIKGDEPWYAASLKLLDGCAAAARDGSLRREEKIQTTCAPVVNPMHNLPVTRPSFAARALDPDLYVQARAVFVQLKDRAERLRTSRRSYGAMPLRLLIASSHLQPTAPSDSGDANPENISFVRASIIFAELSTDGRAIIVPNSWHAIHFARPDIVAATIVETLPAAGAYATVLSKLP
jgi:pimeloyl-ACP methyl ester carboxylesterase